MRRASEVPRQNSLVEVLVGAASRVILASHFGHDAVHEEGSAGLIEQRVDSIHPHLVSGNVVHDCTRVQHHASVRGSLDFSRASAVVGGREAVVDAAVRIDHHDLGHPVVDFVGPVQVSAITGVASKAGGELEEIGVGFSIFVVVPIIKRKDLPAHAAAAGRDVPAGGLIVKDVGGDLQP